MPSQLGITGVRGVLAPTVMQTWAADYQRFEGDVADFSSLLAWLEKCGPLDGLVHLAARVAIRRVEEDPWGAFQSNVAGTCNLLEAARRTGCPWTFVASTSHVYSSSPAPLSEDSPLEPISLYGQTKLQAEQWATIYRDKFKMPICVGRIFSYTSPRQPASYLVPGLFRRFAEAEPHATLEIHGLAGSRDFLGAEEVAGILEQLFERRAEGTFNLASGVAQPLSRVAEEVGRLSGREDVKIRAAEGDHQHLVADISRLKALGINPQASLETILGRFVSR